MSVITSDYIQTVHNAVTVVIGMVSKESFDVVDNLLAVILGRESGLQEAYILVLSICVTTSYPR